MAFGTGVHETTRLCIEALEDYLQARQDACSTSAPVRAFWPRRRDLLGAGMTYACDIDPVAVEIARLRLYRIGGCGGFGAADLVVANISPEAIIRLAPDLVRVLRPAAVLLASGFEVNEVAAGAGCTSAGAWKSGKKATGHYSLPGRIADGGADQREIVAGAAQFRNSCPAAGSS